MTPYYDREEWPGFLASIRANPDDDLPRLVAADFLEENGEPERAEFVRVGCAFRRHPHAANIMYGDYDATDGVGPEWADGFYLRDREGQLFEGHKCRWFGVVGQDVNLFLGSDTSGIRGTTLPAYISARGFVSRVRAPLAVLCGGGCWNCLGEGWADTRRGGRPDNLDCPACHGTGRTPGVLRELLRREPLGPEGIEVSNREPHHNAHGSYSWWCDSMSGETTTADLPRELWERLVKVTTEYGGYASRYSTEPAARLALSRAVYAMCSG